MFQAPSSGTCLAAFIAQPNNSFIDHQGPYRGCSAGIRRQEGKAAMGNYNHFMTIQEMIDIVAFLKHGSEVKRKSSKEFAHSALRCC
jgi:hypothetical protein